MSQILKIRELMEKHKNENPLFTLRCCVEECYYQMNDCMNEQNRNDLTFWVEMYDYFAEKTSNFNKYLDQFRVWQNYDDNIRYCYIKDFSHNYNLQVSSESCELHMRFDTDSHTLDDAIEMYKADSRYQK